jgi:DNA repair exonuclease SbcCD ATPase subunit
MIIRRLYFKNFGCFAEQVLEFDQNRSVFMLHGKNGRGKSTILQGLSLHLINDIQDTLKELIRWETTEFYTEIDFNYNGHEYFQFIRCDGASERVLIVDGDDLHPFKNSDAIKKLASVLDPKMFKASAFAMQNSVDITDTSPAERQNYLMKVYDLQFTKSIENLDGARNGVESSLLKYKTEKLGLENTRYDFLEIALLPFGETGFSRRQTQVAGLQSFLTLVDYQIETRKNLEELIEGLKTTISELEQAQNNSSSVLLSHRGQLRELSSTHSGELVELDISLRKSLDDLEQRRSVISESLGDEPTFVETQEFTDEVEKYRSQVSVANENLSCAQNQVTLRKQGKCPTCGGVFDGSDLIMMESELVGLAAAQEAVTDILSQKKHALLDYENRKREFDKLTAIYVASLEMLSNLDKQIADHRVSMTSQQSRLKASQAAQVIQMQSMTDVLELNLSVAQKSLLDEQSNLIEKTEELLNFPATNNDAIAQSREQLSMLQNEIMVYQNTLAANVQATKLNAAILLQQSADLMKVAELLCLISQEEIRLAHHVSAIKILKKDFPSYIVSSLIDGIVNEMNNFLSMAYNKYHVSLEEAKAGIRIVYGPYKADVSRASGYEKQIFSSAWRYAREQLTGYGIAFLDEADSASDKDNGELFYRTLMSTNLYENGQLLIISHKDETRQLLEQEFEAGIFEIA